MKVTAYLYPNPPFEGATLTDIWGNAYPMRNKPFLEIQLCGSSWATMLWKFSPRSGCRRPSRLNRPINPSSSAIQHSPILGSRGAVRISQGLRVEEFPLSLSVHKLTGQVRDFQRRPFPAYVWAVTDTDSPQAIVRTDDEDRFTLWYPEGRPLRVFIDDESYSKTTYECWIVSEELKGDVQINPRVGDLELWGLHVWQTQLHWQIYFWPCSLPLDLRAKRLGREFSAPRLREEEITVRIDGEGVPLLGVHRVQVHVAQGRAHEAYLLDPPLYPKRPSLCEPTLVQVEVHTATHGRGEAWYIAW